VREQLQLQRILFLHIDDLQHALHQLSDEEIQAYRIIVLNRPDDRPLCDGSKAPCVCGDLLDEMS
jgi:hypothetical protein